MQVTMQAWSAVAALPFMDQSGRGELVVSTITNDLNHAFITCFTVFILILTEDLRGYLDEINETVFECSYVVGKRMVGRV